MGEIADGLIDGDFDFFSGEYLGEGSGFPRSNSDDIDTHRTPRGNNPLKGIRNYLRNRGVIKKGDQRELMVEFVGEKQMSNQDLAKYITNDWSKFIGFVKNKL